MPPRIPTSSQALLLTCTEAAASPLSHTTSTLPAAAWLQWHHHQQTSSFSTTQPCEITRQRKLFWQWIRGPGAVYRDPTKPSMYVKSTHKALTTEENDRPFPQNPEFKSQSVVSEQGRELIWKSVMEEGQPIKAVSARFSVDMRRVAAVLRMKAIEKQWKAEGKPMAIPYAKAVMRMVPTNPLGSIPHEPINDIHVHSYTMQQVFFPTSESREFTRHDAAKAFGEKILPVDYKMRIPELLGLEKDLASGVARHTAEQNFMQAAMRSERAIADKEIQRRKIEEVNKTRVDSGRFEFRFENMNVEAAGRDGRSRHGVGWRYGAPYTDRKKGEVKIPTKVE